MQVNTTAEQLKNEFQITLSKFAHEIRNPLALINSELHLMASSHPELINDPQWEDLQDNLDYVKELLNEFSNYNNADKLSLHPVAPDEFLRNILSSEQATLDYLGIALDTDISDSTRSFPIDRLKMRQALLNLLRNATESITHTHGRIKVCLRNTGQGICISIEDNGCGMTQEQMNHIFSPFVTSKPTGTGLGLAITKQIIQAHGGHIEVTSQPDQGSVFKLFLG